MDILNKMDCFLIYLSIFVIKKHPDGMHLDIFDMFIKKTMDCFLMHLSIFAKKISRWDSSGYFSKIFINDSKIMLLTGSCMLFCCLIYSLHPGRGGCVRVLRRSPACPCHLSRSRCQKQLRISRGVSPSGLR